MMLTAATSVNATALAAAKATEAQGFLSPTGVEVAFLLVGLVTLGAAVMTVTTKQLVHAALWLVVALGGLAVEYLLLTAEFIAWVQVLIYVGSVVVLLLFGLMLTRAPIGRSPDADSGNRWVALAVALSAAVALVWVVVDAFRATWIDLSGPAQGSTAVTGSILFRHWVLPFEALSVLLLAALVGAIVLSRKRGQEPTPGRGAKPRARSPQGPRVGPTTATSPAATPARANQSAGTAADRPAGREPSHREAGGASADSRPPAEPAARPASVPSPKADEQPATAPGTATGSSTPAADPPPRSSGTPATAPEGES